MSLPYNRVRHHRNHRLPHRKQQQGVVIVIALFIVALVATMAYLMMSRLERDTRRTTLLVRDAQAEGYAQGSIAWAIDQLKTDWEKQRSDRFIDNTPMASPVNEVKGYRIQSIIYDAEARFNVNNLTQLPAQEDFKQLLRVMDPKFSEEKSSLIIRAIVDWIAPFAQESAYDDIYFTLPLPYRSAHRSMLSTSELRLVRGMTPELFNILQPYIIALPVATLVNVQSAEAPVLATLSVTLNLATAKEIEQLRQQRPFLNKQDFFNRDIVKNHAINASKVADKSDYFWVETTVTIEKQHLVLYTLLERVSQGRKVAMNILWQSKGTE